MSAIFARDLVSAVSAEECAELSLLAEDKLVLELGSDYGRSTIALASTASIVFAVDWHLGDPHAGQRDTAGQFMMNITRYNVRHKIVAVIGDARVALPRLRERIFDLVFLDAYHDYTAVSRDINQLFPLVKPHGIMAFHDYTVPDFGVKRAVDELASQLFTNVVQPVHSLAYLHV
jgi:predicted O-methyltransferase YrrM